MKKNEKTIAIVIGTRPEIIKCAPVIDECRRRRMRFFVVHTGQHYSPELDSVFFRDLRLDPPAYNLGVGSLPAGEMIGRMMLGLTEIFTREKPDIVLVQGDTNSVLAGALTGRACGALVGHIEAGLRSFDRAMPEEINRLATDAVSDMLFAPTREARAQLMCEQIGSKRIHVVGNTVVDALHRNVRFAKRTNILKQYALKPGTYAVLTLHRPSNVDDPERLTELLRAIGNLPREEVSQIVFPVHPRTRARIESAGIAVPSSVLLIEPVGYLDFLHVLSLARIALTDSGGVQEEACVLRVPCVTLRDNTERPETIAVGANVLANPKTLPRAVSRMLAKKRTWKNPFGDGHAAKRILDILLRV